MKWRFALVVSAMSLAAAGATAEPTVYRNAEYGFRLQPPAFTAEDAFGISATPIMFQGPIKDGAASSCNVQVQNMSLNSAQYRELSLNQFKAIGLSLDAEEKRKVSGKEAVVWRYGGAGVKAIALVVYTSKRIYLMTCLAPAARFAEEEARFVSSINSFSLE